MTPIREKSRMPEDFFCDRSKLVRLCRTLTGDPDAAEDLAQETLAEAWRSRDKQRNAGAAEAWLHGIARNVCRRHFRRLSAEQRVQHLGAERPSEDWAQRKRGDEAALLQDALGFLPPVSRQILSARYLDGLTLAQIAHQSGCTENTAAVRLGRAREALRGVLETRLRQDAAAMGLVREELPWRQTRVWCFRCGATLLEERVAHGGLSVRCPRCDGKEADIAFSTLHAAMDPVQILGGVKSCKPSLRRINAWWDARLRRSLASGTLPCWRCAGGMARTQSALDDRSLWHRVLFCCRHCGAQFSLPASGLAFHSPAVQEFWRQNPRLRVRPERRIEISGRSVIVTRYEAIGSTAAIERLYDAASFHLLG